jgi:hypothetical protein
LRSELGSELRAWDEAKHRPVGFKLTQGRAQSRGLRFVVPDARVEALHDDKSGDSNVIHEDLDNADAAIAGRSKRRNPASAGRKYYRRRKLSHCLSNCPPEDTRDIKLKN